MTMQVVSFAGNNINDGTNYSARLLSPALGLPKLAAKLAEREGRWPLVARLDRSGRTLLVEVTIKGNGDTLRPPLLQWFDPESETARELVIEDANGANDRFVLAVCESFEENDESGGFSYLATLKVHGDVRWRKKTVTTQAWSITASGQTVAVTNNGKDEAYPVIKIKPTSNKTGGYAWMRWISLRWKSDMAGSQYFVDVVNGGLDTATLVGAGKMQADGDDLRVIVDGIEAMRWLDSINTANTRVWVRLDYQPAMEIALKTAIAGTGSITTIELTINNESSPPQNIDRWPDAGVVIIGSEAFAYTGISRVDGKLTGVTRAAKGTSAAAHSVGDTVWVNQHDIVLVYGNASISAPSVDNNQKPMFGLGSTNTSWDFTEFGEDDGLRAATWQKQKAMAPNPLVNEQTLFYTADHATNADPWEELGLELGANVRSKDKVRWVFFNPCRLTAANFQTGEKYVKGSTAEFSASILSAKDGTNWSLEYTVPAPSTIDTWEIWSQNETLFPGVSWVALQLEVPSGYGASDIRRIEVSRITLTLDSNYTPVVVIGAETGNYTVAARLTNTTTGEAVDVNFQMALNTELEIDTDEKTVTYLADTTNRFPALTIVPPTRKEWLRLASGSNTLQYDDTGTNGVTVTIEYEERNHA